MNNAVHRLIRVTLVATVIGLATYALSGNSRPAAKRFATQARVAGSARSPAQWGSVSSTAAWDGSAATRPIMSGNNALVLSNFGFSIPSGATVTAVRLKHVVAKEEGDCPDDLAVGVTLDASGTGYPAGHGNVRANLGGGCGTYTDQGPQTFTWTLLQPIPTAAQINSSDFGLIVTAPINPVTSHHVDYIELEVEYTP